MSFIKIKNQQRIKFYHTINTFTLGSALMISPSNYCCSRKYMAMTVNVVLLHEMF
jgi:hypothetical protein